MRAKFDGQLNMLGLEMIQMGAMIETSIRKAITALTSQDVELAGNIMEANREIDQEQKYFERIGDQWILFLLDDKNGMKQTDR